MQRDVLIVGINHRTAPVEVREQLAFATNGAVEDVLKRLSSEPEIDEAVVVSTCNRVEVVACSGEPDVAARRIEDMLTAEQGLAAAAFEAHLYRLRGREAVRHLFRVAASLDSMVVGEPQILGQLKDSYATSAAIGASKAVLHRCFHGAFAVAKRVRRETAIARKAVSVASATVELARSIFEDLEGRTAMLIGAGEMSALTARHLVGHGVKSFLVTNRTFDRAVEVARECTGTPVPFEQYVHYLHMADVVIGAAAGDRLLTREIVQRALRNRKHTPMFLIDLAVPRSFAPEINELDNAYLYDIDDLEAIARDNQEGRGREAVKAEIIVDAAVDNFVQWFDSLDVVPAIVALRRKVEDIREREIAKNSGLLASLTVEQRNAVERLTGAIVNKIVHGPITQLKRDHGSGRDATAADAVLRLFGLAEGLSHDDGEE
jgi:glutamyl-tRNA reductase